MCLYSSHGWILEIISRPYFLEFARKKLTMHLLDIHSTNRKSTPSKHRQYKWLRCVFFFIFVSLSLALLATTTTTIIIVAYFGSTHPVFFLVYFLGRFLCLVCRTQCNAFKDVRPLQTRAHRYADLTSKPISLIFG